jgi:hypothetical protein
MKKPKDGKCPDSGHESYWRQIFPLGFYRHFGSFETPGEDESMEDDSHVRYASAEYVICAKCGRAVNVPPETRINKP